MSHLVWVLLALAVIYAAATRLRMRAVRRDAGFSQARADQATARLAALYEALDGQVALLEATRDLALVANDDVELSRIVRAVDQIVSRLLGARRVQVLLAGPDEVLDPAEGGALDPAARRLAQRAVDGWGSVEEALDDGRRLAVSLPADGGLAGVLLVELDARLDPRAAGRSLVAIQKPVALAIRKPALYERAVLDPLTGLYTKRHFCEELGRLSAQSRRTGEPLALVLIDVDRFKAVNDTYGHLAGDTVLAQVSRRVRARIRDYDTAHRYGGEELVILAPGADAPEALALAERVREDVASLPIEIGSGERLHVTVSIGVATYCPELDTPEQLIEAADRALYRAKREGRDRVASASAELAAFRRRHEAARRPVAPHAR